MYYDVYIATNFHAFNARRYFSKPCTHGDAIQYAAACTPLTETTLTFSALFDSPVVHGHIVIAEDFDSMRRVSIWEQPITFFLTIRRILGIPSLSDDRAWKYIECMIRNCSSILHTVFILAL